MGPREQMDGNREHEVFLNQDCTVCDHTLIGWIPAKTCLIAIQDPTTTYTKTNSGNWGTYMIDGYRVAYSNMPVADGTIYDRLYPGRKISSNETIEVIPTE